MDFVPLTESPTRLLVRWLRSLPAAAQDVLFLMLGEIAPPMAILGSLPRGSDPSGHYPFALEIATLFDRLEALGTTPHDPSFPPADASVAVMACGLIDYLFVYDCPPRRGGAVVVPEPWAAPWVVEWQPHAAAWRQLRAGPLSVVSIRAWDQQAYIDFFAERLDGSQSHAPRKP